jgi:hypothetical protein
LDIDFGSGLTVDELIGWPAAAIAVRKLPDGESFKTVGDSALILMEKGFGEYLLSELWGDGHCVWQHPDTGQTALVTPTGQVISPRN